MKRCIIIIVILTAMLSGCEENDCFSETASSLPEIDGVAEFENVENSVGETDPPVTAADIPSAEEPGVSSILC